MNRLKDKVCIITGAAQGIGECMARLFVAEGAKVVLADIQVEKAEKVADSLKSGADVFALYVNTNEEESISIMVKKTIDKFGRIDVLINNAGKNFYYDPLKITTEQWNECLQNDLTSVWNCCRFTLPHMLQRNYGNIINIASVHAEKIIKGYFPYAVVKHAVLGLTKTLAIEYADRNVRVNAIAPGFINTPSSEAFLNQFSDPEAARQREIDALPGKRLGTPEDVAQTALFLASNEAPFINAECIVADGGRSVVYNDLAAT